MLRLLLIAALTLAPELALGQSTTSPEAPAAKCLLAGKSFSPGATVRASASVNVCGPDGNWAVTQQTASGCFLADNFYSVGASAAVTGSKAAVELCGPDGSWTTTATP